jgi:hypothetical protein
VRGHSVAMAAEAAGAAAETAAAAAAAAAAQLPVEVAAYCDGLAEVVSALTRERDEAPRAAPTRASMTSL